MSVDFPSENQNMLLQEPSVTECTEYELLARMSATEMEALAILSQGRDFVLLVKTVIIKRTGQRVSDTLPACCACY